MTLPIEKFTVRNFNKIKKLDLECRRVNIIIGGQGVGKTTLLQSVIRANQPKKHTTRVHAVGSFPTTEKEINNLVWPAILTSRLSVQYGDTTNLLKIPCAAPIDNDKLSELLSEVYPQADIDRERIQKYKLGLGSLKLTLIYELLISLPLKVVLLQNVDDGLHYTTLNKLASNLQKLTQETGNQVFAVVNSYEFLQFIFNAFEQADDLHNLQFIRLEPCDQNGVKPIVIKDENLQTIIEAKYEIR